MMGNCDQTQANTSPSCQPGETGTNGRVKRYSKISYETRKELIKRVLKEGQKLSQASADLGIKLSTSKFILKSFKRFGRIFKKKSVDDANRLRPTDLSQSSSEPEEEEPAEVTPPEPVQVACVYYPIYIYCPTQWTSEGQFPMIPSLQPHFGFQCLDLSPK